VEFYFNFKGKFLFNIKTILFDLKSFEIKSFSFKSLIIGLIYIFFAFYLLIRFFIWNCKSGNKCINY